MIPHHHRAVPRTNPMPKKEIGRHRWIAIVTYSLSEASVRAHNDPDVPKFLDEENRVNLMVGCYDCEQSIDEIEVESSCPARDADAPA